MWVDPQADASSRIRRQILSAETPPKKNYGYSNKNWNQHSNKWL